MPKGQSFIVQFIIFFLIGLGLFIIIGNVFKVYSSIFREDVTSNSRKLLNSYFSFLSVMSVDTCKQCDYVEIKTKITNTTADYFHEIQLSQSGLNIISQPGGKNFLTSLHNFNETYTLTGSSSSVEIITFRFEKNKNKLEVK
jgi:hypothetical protein